MHCRVSGEQIQLEIVLYLAAILRSVVLNYSSNHSKYIGQYVLRGAIEVVQLFVPPRGSGQLCTPLAAWCGLAE